MNTGHLCYTPCKSGACFSGSDNQMIFPWDTSALLWQLTAQAGQHSFQAMQTWEEQIWQVLSFVFPKACNRMSRQQGPNLGKSAASLSMKENSWLWVQLVVQGTYWVLCLPIRPSSSNVSFVFQGLLPIKRVLVKQPICKMVQWATHKTTGECKLSMIDSQRYEACIAIHSWNNVCWSWNGKICQFTARLGGPPSLHPQDCEPAAHAEPFSWDVATFLFRIFPRKGSALLLLTQGRRARALSELRYRYTCTTSADLWSKLLELSTFLDSQG